MQPKIYPYDTRKEEAKIMRALVAAGDAGLTRGQIWRIVYVPWKVERALRRLSMFDKARCVPRKFKPDHQRRPERWFALVADDTMEHGLDPEWTIEIDGA
jgi:hypothetical protein